MEKFIESLPKPLLAFLVILGGVLLFMVLEPPHTVCDTQAEALKISQTGPIFPSKDKKRTIPPTLARAKEACQMGNSGGSCYEYFQVLKRLADDIAKSSSECATQLYNIAEVRSALNDGIEMMIRLAWGVKPPDPSLDRFGWMQESEIAIFCRIKSVYLRANGEEAWAELRKKISTKLPGEEVPAPEDPTLAAIEPRNATLTLNEQDIWNRSLFSVRCESFR